MQLLTGTIAKTILLFLLIFPAASCAFIMDRRSSLSSPGVTIRNGVGKKTIVHRAKNDQWRRTMASSSSSIAQERIAFMRGGATVALSSSFDSLTCLVNMALPAAAVSSAMWLVLAFDIRTTLARQQKTGGEPNKRIITQEMMIQLRDHRLEKLASLKGAVLPLIPLLVACSAHAKSLRWQESLWQHGPSGNSLGLSFAFWAAEIAMDTALDECGPLQPFYAAAFSGVVQLAMIVVLTTNRRGHIVFLLKAIVTLLATALAKGIDNLFWIGIATMASSFVAVMALTGRLAALPPGVPATGAIVYFAATLFSSTAYHLVQNRTWASSFMGHVKMVRAGLGCLSMVFAGTPPSWVLCDSFHYANFFCLKIATDTIALWALQLKNE
mmetsp:Transcript_23491/g.34813  ORF Transcript_23491/g.34813 Transcript_23491/m.34813 type:complete len:383 (-) Transcript_23491:411-1559(-)